MGATYRPHFLRIRLPFKVKSDISQYNPNELSRFIHEYIHFLQNVYTPWGLFSSFQSYNIIKNKLDVIRKNHTEEISIPFQCEPSDHAKWFNDIYAIGDGGRISLTKKNVDNIAFIPENPIILHRKRIEVNGVFKSYITFEIDTILYGKQEIVLGAWIIKESMAQIIQQSLSLQAKEQPTDKVIPYDFVTTYCEQVAPSVYKDKNKQVAICWAALFSMTPGEEFVNLVDFAERNPQLTAYEIFSHYIKESKISIKGSEHKYTFGEFMEDIRPRFISHLESFVEQECEYFRYILSGKSIDDVFSHLSEIVDAQNVDMLESIIQELGMPVVFGEGNSSCFPGLFDNPTSFQPLLKLFAYELVYDFITSKECTCPSYSMCKADETIETQYECVSNPLMINIDCPMFFSSKLLGMHGKNINVAME